MGSSSKKRKRDRDRLARQETPTDSVGSRAEASKVLEDVWAQCEKCNKWRRLPPGSVVQEDDPWFCAMNNDTTRNRCDVPEENYSDDEWLGDFAGDSSSPGALQKGKAGSPGNGSNRSNFQGPWRLQDKAKRASAKQPPQKHPSQLGSTVLAQHLKTLSVALGNAAMWPAGASTSHSSSRMSLDIWRSMHAIAPEACHAVAAAANAATASGYFRMESANGNAVADRYEQLSWAAVLAGAAIGRGKATAYLQNPARPQGKIMPGGSKPPLPPPQGGAAADGARSQNPPERQDQQQAQGGTAADPRGLVPPSLAPGSLLPASLGKPPLPPSSHS